MALQVSVSQKMAFRIDSVHTTVDIAAVEIKRKEHEPAPCHDPEVDLPMNQKVLREPDVNILTFRFSFFSSSADHVISGSKRCRPSYCASSYTFLQ